MSAVIKLADHRPARAIDTTINQTADVAEFKPRLLMCSVCGSGHHRASQCPGRPKLLQIDG